MKITIVGKMTGYTAEHTAFDQLRAVASSIMMKEEEKDESNRKHEGHDTGRMVSAS